MTYDIAWKVKNEIPIGKLIFKVFSSVLKSRFIFSRTNVKYLNEKSIPILNITEAESAALLFFSAISVNGKAEQPVDKY